MNYAKFDNFKELIVIGDVHGNLKALNELVSLVRDKWPEVPIVLTGDVCDRGPDTRGVIQYCIDLGLLSVLGNHDQWLKKAMLSGQVDPDWMCEQNGGMATLYSYIGPTDRTIARFPVEHVRWVATLPLVLRFPEVRVEGREVVVTHAPLDGPVEELDHGSPWNPVHMPWIYNTPWQKEDLFGICGHMMYPKPTRRVNVFYIDTGCGAGGALSAVKLPELEVVSVGGSPEMADAIETLSFSYPVKPAPSQRREDAAAAFAELPVEDNF